MFLPVLRMHTRITVALTAFLLALCASAWASERGYFGFGFSLDAEGMFWNPTLRSVKIEKVAPKSPAALAGILVGDDVIEVAGKVVAGAKGNDIKGYIEKDVGESVQLKVRHANGEIVSVTLVAAARTW